MRENDGTHFGHRKKFFKCWMDAEADLLKRCRDIEGGGSRSVSENLKDVGVSDLEACKLMIWLHGVVAYSSAFWRNTFLF
jgi:hypothetical protein